MNPKDYLVLYVDDEWPNRLVFEQSFGNRFQIKTVASGQEALEVCKQQRVAVLITDQRMPVMSGNDLLLRAKELYPDTVRVIITAFSDLDPILRAVNDGLVSRYLIKPWDRAELEQVLLWAIEAFALSQQNSALQLRLMQTERLVTLGSIGAAVIHDLNQPLSYLANNTQRLAHLSESSAALAKLVAAHGATLSENERQNLADLASELPEIVNDMLLGCRLMSGITHTMRKLLDPQRTQGGLPTDPMPIIRYAMAVCRNIALSAQGSISYDGPQELPKLKIGFTELAQIFINIISNAAQALHQRGEPGGEVMLHAAETTTEIRFTVRDNGPGMTAEVLAKVGTPFFSTRPQGTGLGVSQCRRLIERENGTFQVESAVGAGTTVSIALPRA